MAASWRGCLGDHECLAFLAFFLLLMLASSLEQGQDKVVLLF